MILFNKFELIRAFAQVLDLVNLTLAAHHQRTAFIADQLCRRLSLKQPDHQRTVLAASLHDVGIVPLGSKVDDLLFEHDLDRHSQAGWMLLNTCPLLKEEASLIRYHHYHWPKITRLPAAERRAGQLANIIQAADQMDIASRTGLRAENLAAELAGQSGKVFAPAIVEAARDFLARPEALESLTPRSRELTLAGGADLELTMEDLTTFARLFAQLIDSRSRFTATHSTAVAHLGSLLYFLSNSDDCESESMFLAGLLHDVGKLGVPQPLIEKAGPLTDLEMSRVREHALIGYQALSNLPGFERVALWGGLHHERMNGTGYPFGLFGHRIPVESRFVAVADVLTALTEDRPYRPGLDDEEAMKIMFRMVKAGELDGDVVALVNRRLKEFSALRRRVQYQASEFAGHLTRKIKLEAGLYPPAVWTRVSKSSETIYT